MRVAVIFGTRPEAIKLAPIILALKREAALECHVCVTGQHRQMLDQVLEVFDIAPDVDLNLMEPNQSLAGLTVRAIEAVDNYLGKHNPSLVLVQGDTTTVFCAAFAAFYRKIPVGHVEAGLRTWNLQAPWPEEANRVLTSRLATLHFAPTELARQNLLREGTADEAITVTGNTVIDALLMALEKVHISPPRIKSLPIFLQPFSHKKNGLPKLVLITGHRRENFGDGFENICRAIAELARRFPEIHFVYPVHLNPNVRKPVMCLLGNRDTRRGTNNIHLIDPIPYLPFVGLMDHATLILTDSGGIQEEAPSLGKPVLVMRDTTERPEAVFAGTVKLVGADYTNIVEETSLLLTNEAACQSMTRKHNPYGDGKAAGRILSVVLRFLFSQPGHRPQVEDKTRD